MITVVSHFIYMYMYMKVTDIVNFVNRRVLNGSWTVNIRLIFFLSSQVIFLAVHVCLSTTHCRRIQTCH